MKDKKTKKIIIYIIVVGIILLILSAIGVGIGYWKKVQYYQQHFFPNTFINSIDCSELDVSAVAELLNGQAQDYSLTILGRNRNGEQTELGIIQGADIALALTDPASAANDILEQQNEWRWYEAYQDARYSYSVVQGVSFDEELLKNIIEGMDALQAKNMVAPTDAYIGNYIEDENIYELIAETEGTQLEMDTVISCVTAAIYGNADKVDLEEHNCYILPAITAQNEDLLANWNAANQWLSAEIIYDWNGSKTVVDKSVIKEWISIEANIPILDEEAVKVFVQENAKQYDTYGKNRKFVTSLGVELSLPSGAFGWKTDCEAEAEELAKLLKAGAVEEREPVYSNTAPQKGSSDIGSSYVEADLTNQHLYLYYKGNLVLESDYVSGDMSQPGCITPQGVFGLTYKTTNAVLRGADYETPVNFWMPFHGNFGMHDATWRTEFGGDHYITGNGSHGCLNLPLDKAAEIYNYMYTGFPVICYYY